jgi:glycylpeptide N-tetradecanoyltransferase
VTENTFIEPSVDVSRIRANPFTLPAPYVWSDLEINNEAELNELYTLLSENYVEDDDNMFRFDYSCEFLRW